MKKRLSFIVIFTVFVFLSCDGGKTVVMGDRSDDGNTGNTVPPECYGDEKRTIPCGVGDKGTQEQICENGSWVNDGPCIQWGLWDCIDNVCTPNYGHDICGNGTCEVKFGESKKSCPEDCDNSGMIALEQDCNDPIDCAFYDWPSDKTGYWECKVPGISPVGQKKCVATESTAIINYCGTNNNDYCYYSTGGGIGSVAALESDTSCPVDCDNKPLGQGNSGMSCNLDVDCIFLDWPQVD